MLPIPDEKVVSGETEVDDANANAHAHVLPAAREAEQVQPKESLPF